MQQRERMNYSYTQTCREIFKLNVAQRKQFIKEYMLYVQNQLKQSYTVKHPFVIEV